MMVDLYIISVQLKDTLHNYTGRQIVWISDGHHSVHMIDISSAVNENDKRENEGKLIQISGFLNTMISFV